MKRIILSIITLLSLSATMLARETLTSPDGKLSMQFAIGEQGRMTYMLMLGNDTLVRPSHLGLDLVNDQLLYGF